MIASERPVVLVVDDEESARVKLSTLLERAGFDVLEAESGVEGLKAFVDNPVRVVVTDIVMTDGDGVSLIAWLQSLKPGSPVIAVSGKGQAGLQAALGIGARAALTKPVDPDELVRAVRESLDDEERIS